MRGCNKDGTRHDHMDEQGEEEEEVNREKDDSGAHGRGDEGEAGDRAQREAEIRRKEEIQTCC